MEVASFQTHNAAPTIELSGWMRRAVAYLIDLVIVLFIAGFIIGLAIGFTERAAGDGSDGGAATTATVTLIAAFLTIPLYFMLGNGGSSGQTLGKKIMGIAVRRENGDEVGYARALGRYLTMAAIGFIPILSLFAVFRPLWDPENRAFHDDIVHTRVVGVR